MSTQREVVLILISSVNEEDLHTASHHSACSDAFPPHHSRHPHSRARCGKTRQFEIARLSLSGVPAHACCHQSPARPIRAAAEEAAFSVGKGQGRLRDGTGATAGTRATHACQKIGNPPSVTEPCRWDFALCTAAGCCGQARKAIKENNQARTLTPPERSVRSRRCEGSQVKHRRTKI